MNDEDDDYDRRYEQLMLAAHHTPIPQDLTQVLKELIEPVTVTHELDHQLVMEVFDAAYPTLLDYFRHNVSELVGGLLEGRHNAYFQISPSEDGRQTYHAMQVFDAHTHREGVKPHVVRVYLDEGQQPLAVDVEGLVGGYFAKPGEKLPTGTLHTADTPAAALRHQEGQPDD
jgi:hypothetical protein